MLVDVAHKILMGMSPGTRELVVRCLRERVKRCQEMDRKLREALEGAYEVVPGDHRYCVRRLEVVEHVARVLGIPVLNNAVFADVEAAASALGFQAIRNGNRSLFRCAKRRDYDNETALALSRANRRDPRTGKLRPKGTETMR